MRGTRGYSSGNEDSHRDRGPPGFIKILHFADGESVKNALIRLAGHSALLLCLLTPGAAASAQSPPSGDLMSMNLEDLTRVKVYSASRHLENASVAPSAVSVISAEDNRRYGWRTLGDALRSLRGFYTSYDRQYTYLGVRGFLRPGDYNSRVLVLINGHRTNENIYDSSFVGAEFSLDLDLVDRIEVVRGPGSSLYGTNAVLCVINVITRTPSAKLAVESSGVAASFFDRSGRFTITGGTGGASALLSASMDHAPGPLRLYFPQFASLGTNNGYADNMDGGHILQAFGNYSVGGVSLQALYADRRKTYPTASYGSVFNNPADWNEDTRAYFDASFSRSLASHTDLQLRAYYDNYDYVGADAITQGGSAGNAVLLTKSRADWVGAEANFSRPIGGQRISAGADYEYSIDVVQNNFYVGQLNNFYSNESPWFAAVYGEAELNFIPEVTVHAGGRLDKYSTFGQALSPRIAVVYAPNAKTTLKYISGSAFRAPNAYEEFYVDDIVVTQAPQKLRPERILSNELVFERKAEPWLQFTADAYYYQLKEVIDQVPTSGGLTYFVNNGRVHAEGIELELNAANSSGFMAKASYELSWGFNDQTATPLVNSPRGQLKLNGSMPVSRQGIAAVDLIYSSAMTDYAGTRVPAYVLPSLTFSTKPVWNGWTFSASCYNAPNAAWYSPMGPNDPEDKIQMDGRTFRFKVNYRIPLHRERREP